MAEVTPRRSGERLSRYLDGSVRLITGYVAEGTLMGLFDFFKKPTAAMPALSADAQSLFTEVARDEKGELVKIRVPGQVIWDTNGKQFADEKGPGKEGRWKVAIEELVAAELIGPIGMSPYKLYMITKKGAAVAKSAAARPAT